MNIWLPMSEIAFLSSTGHMYICWYKAISAINLFKQPKCTSEVKLLYFKNFANCKVFTQQ